MISLFLSFRTSMISFLQSARESNVWIISKVHDYWKKDVWIPLYHQILVVVHSWVNVGIAIRCQTQKMRNELVTNLIPGMWALLQMNMFGFIVIMTKGMDGLLSWMKHMNIRMKKGEFLRFRIDVKRRKVLLLREWMEIEVVKFLREIGEAMQEDEFVL